MGAWRHLLNTNPVGRRTGKLLAGVRYSLHISTPGKSKLDCSACKKRDKLNCKNRKGLKFSILNGAEEWKLAHHKAKHHGGKFSKTKFFECPLSAITPKTWRIMEIVNQTTDEDCNIVNLPYPGLVTEQPRWYTDAVSIVKSERARHRAEQMEKTNAK